MYGYFEFLMQIDKWSPAIHLDVLPWHLFLDEV
jgi:hypothetical protein